MLTQERLKELLHYNPETGVFVWIVSPRKGMQPGIAGSATTTGYRFVIINYKRWPSHRLAWLYMTGSFPEKELDHINLIRGDNRWKNLREASRSENMRNTARPSNNTSGVKGVHWHKPSKRWTARIKINGFKKHLGGFKKFEDAVEAINKARPLIHGEFSRQ